MLLKCEYLNLWQRLGEVICQSLLTIQSMKGIERGIEKSYFLPGCSSYILFAVVAPCKKTKSSSSSFFIFCSFLFPESRDDLYLLIMVYFNFSRIHYRLLPHTVVPPYSLIQYPRFQLSIVYRGPKKN
jgi:hypothetical protein